MMACPAISVALPRGLGGHCSHGKAPVFLRLLQAVARQNGVGLFQHARGKSLRGGGRQVLRGIVAGLRGYVVEVADYAIRPAIHLREARAEAVVKRHLQQPVEAPLGFFKKAVQQFGIFVSGLHALRQTEHGVGRLGGVAERLRKVSGIVPAAIHHQLLVAVLEHPIAVAHVVHAGNG